MVRYLFLAPLALCLLQQWSNSDVFGRAWVSPIVTPSARRTARSFGQPRSPILFSTPTTDAEENKEKDADKSSSATAMKEQEAPKEDEDEEDDDEEYEYIEYETLTEADYLGSEWLVGTCWDTNRNKVDETWVRLAANEDKNIAIWGDGSEGKWSLDVASQFLAISKEYLWGKQIWAGVVDDYYFCQGTVRGWTYLTPASVLGQWQSKRLGVDPGEAGTPPWFEEEEEEAEEASAKEEKAKVEVKESAEAKEESKE